MWELDHKNGWALKKYALELWCWRKPLRIPWTARRSNQSILKEMNPEYSLNNWCWSWSSNISATCCEEPTHWKRPDAGKIEGRRRRGQQRIRQLNGIINSMDVSLSKLQEMAKDREAWHVAVHGVANRWMWLSDWATARPFLMEGCFLTLLLI